MINIPNGKSLRIIQLCDALLQKDGVSNDIIEIKKILDKNRIQNKIYTKFSDIEVRNWRKKFRKFKIKKNDIIFFHYSGYSNLVKEILDTNCTKALFYHNITPAKFFKNFNSSYYQNSVKARNQLKEICKKFDYGIGVSDFNCNELKNNGLQKTFTLPIIKNFDNQPKIETKLDKDIITILFVGRIAPNKKQDNLIKSFYLYNKLYYNKSKLILVGDKNHTPKYLNKIKDIIKKLDLNKKVILPGLVSNKDLGRYYKNANIFLCLSEHEGFCIPLIEAMHYQIPIIALKNTAIAETMGNETFLVNDKNPLFIAECINAIVKNKKMQQYILKNQNIQLEKYSITNLETKLVSIINQICH